MVLSQAKVGFLNTQHTASSKQSRKRPTCFEPHWNAVSLGLHASELPHRNLCTAVIWHFSFCPRGAEFGVNSTEELFLLAKFIN